MIQEKDFLYRVPVKTAPITTPGGQIRNPEILVDVEGGEFMHGNILDANSTNKLINQSVKDAVDNKLIESGYVTQDLLEAETTRATEQENSLKTLIGAEASARTKGDEDLSSKIKAEQTRAEGKEKEISDKLAIVNGDSNTEGSFRKAIADVVAAAPEDLDTLKEIADKLAGNDYLHTALNQAITEKADASALLNEVTRATGAESGLQAAIATKADATALDGAKTELDKKISDETTRATQSEIAISRNINALSNEFNKYVQTVEFEQKVDTLNAAISAKQDKGNYITYTEYNDRTGYEIDKSVKFAREGQGYEATITYGQIAVKNTSDKLGSLLSSRAVAFSGDRQNISYSLRGIDSSAYTNCLATSDGSFKPISDFVLKTELPTVPTKTSQLTNDSNFITADDVDEVSYALQKGLKIGNSVNNQLTISSDSIMSTAGNGFVLDDTGITFMGRSSQQIPTAGGDFINISDLASAGDISSLNAGLSKKQNKITVNEVDVTDIETADITKLRTIVTNLINALSESDLIRKTETLE